MTKSSTKLYTIGLIMFMAGAMNGLTWISVLVMVSGLSLLCPGVLMSSIDVEKARRSK